MVAHRARATGIVERADGLARYVARVLKEKRLSRRDVQVMSGWRITDAYVGSIIKGRARNLSVEKLQALARGLGVDEDEIFRVARGAAGSDPVDNRAGDPWHSVMFLRLMERVVSDPDVKEILDVLVELSEEDRAIVLKIAKSFSSTHRKPQRRRVSV
jgi:transcriptional regulator with XRE-family HTH domain